MTAPSPDAPGPTAAQRPRFVHVSSTFGRGGAQVRAVQLINHMGPDVEHVLVAMDDCRDAQDMIDPAVSARFEPPPPKGGFFATRGRLAALLSAQRADLVLTYNWGAIEAVAAAKKARLPVVHHEDGFGPDEVARRHLRRNLFRRWLLRSVPTIVPSHVLLEIARREWGIDAVHLVNGVDLARFHPADEAGDELPDDQAFVVGSVGGLRGEKDYHNLLNAVARMQRTSHEARVVLVGSGGLEGALRAEAARLGLSDRVEFAGQTPDPAPHYRRFSAFALSSRTEQMPISLLEAMATALPVACTDVGDVRRLVSDDNAPFVVPKEDPAALAAALDRLAADRELRARLGAANRRVVEERYEAGECLERFCQVYRSAARTPGGRR